MKFLKTITIILAGIFFLNFLQFHKKREVVIKTDFGNIVIELYNETPKHRDNFIKLIKDTVYNNLLFHRIIKDFMIQGGDPDSKNAQPGEILGNGGLNYTIPAEFIQKFYHKRGVLAAARESDSVNPLKESSSTQFYIVQGKTFTSEQLNKIEEKKNKAIFDNKLKEIKAKNHKDTLDAKAYLKKNKFKFTTKQRKVYMEKGGAPHLDQSYTVFGEVTEGMEVVDKIANLQTDNNDRPINDVRFSIIMKN